MLAALPFGGGRRQVLAEDRRQGGGVGEEEIAEPGDRYVEMHGVDTPAKSSGTHAFLQNLRDHADQRRMHGFELSGTAHMPGATAILVVEQHDEIRMRRDKVR